MGMNLSPTDREKARALVEIRQRNNDFSWLLSDYLNGNPCRITRELVKNARRGSAMSEEAAYIALLTDFFGLDVGKNEADRQLVNDYVRPSVKKLDTKTYAWNPYYRNIRIPEAKFGAWELTHETYRPYEAFIYNNLMVGPGFKEIPRVGYFNEEFRFPAVMENGHEWMAIKPNEIETMQPVINAIDGRIVTFGLGLGYFTYMASLKERIESITVIERDPEVIRLFEHFILPQFQHREKVRIISADAFEYAEKEMPGRHYDCAFVDLWHDVSDGLDRYLKMKKLEKLSLATKFHYWIEASLLSSVRWHIFDRVMETARSYEEIMNRLSNPFQYMSSNFPGVS